MSDRGRIPVGYVRRAHGLRGFVILRPLTDKPEDRFVPGASFTTDEEPRRVLAVAEVRPHRDGILALFEDVTDRDEADRLRGVTLTISPSERRILEPDEYWDDDLVGMVVVAADGRRFGDVVRVVLGQAQDRLVVSADSGNEVEVPFVAAIVLEVSVEAGRITIDPPPGLF